MTPDDDRPQAVPEIAEAREYTAGALCAALRISGAVLRRYRATGIIVPARHTTGGARYDEAAMLRLRTAHRLVRDLGVNYAGAEVALRLLDQLVSLQRDLATAHARLDLLAQADSAGTARGSRNGRSAA